MPAVAFPDKPISWNKEKSEMLQQTRNISFEKILLAMQEGHILDVTPHANREKYAHQNVYVVEIANYIYLVPFVEDEDKIFLKTIIPSRKATKKFLQAK